MVTSGIMGGRVSTAANARRWVRIMQASDRTVLRSDARTMKTTTQLLDGIGREQLKITESHKPCTKPMLKFGKKCSVRPGSHT
jgi:hypothetical protein